MRIPWISAEQPFPPRRLAVQAHQGLLCAGADLSPERLRLAYGQGIFPWFNEGEAICWYAPDPRPVLHEKNFCLSKRDLRYLRNSGWSVYADRAFAEVMQGCAAPRENCPDSGTWLSPRLQEAFVQLHTLGIAHSVEIYQQQELIAGIYGVVSGQVFSAESIFGRQNNASKAALAALVLNLSWAGLRILDAQVGSDHIWQRGAALMARAEFDEHLQHGAAKSWPQGRWPAPWHYGLAS